MSLSTAVSQSNPTALPRVKLSPLPSYWFRTTRTLQFSDCNSTHLDNVAVLKICSDAQQLFYNACLGGITTLQELSWWCLNDQSSEARQHDKDLEMGDLDIFNADVALKYVAEGHRYDNVTIEVGLLGLSRSGLRLGFRLLADRPVLPRSHANAPVPQRRVVLALAEIGCVVVNASKPVPRMPYRIRQALEHVLSEQREESARNEDSSSIESRDKVRAML